MEDQQTLEILAAQVGRIYENGSLYRELQMRAAQLQVEMAERELAAAALGQSKGRFRQLAETIQDVFFIVSSDTNETIYLSPAYERVWGRARNTANPKDWMHWIHPGGCSRESLDELTLNAGKAINSELEYQIIHPRRQHTFNLARQFPLCNAEGRPYRIVGVATDVTERKQADAKIRHLNRVYALLERHQFTDRPGEPRNELFAEACRLAVECGDFRRAWICSVDAAGDQLVSIAWAGDSAEVSELARSGSPGIPEGRTADSGRHSHG